jgi:hypothetical protein
MPDKRYLFSGNLRPEHEDSVQLPDRDPPERVAASVVGLASFINADGDALIWIEDEQGNQSQVRKAQVDWDEVDVSSD